MSDVTVEEVRKALADWGLWDMDEGLYPDEILVAAARLWVDADKVRWCQTHRSISPPGWEKHNQCETYHIGLSRDDDPDGQRENQPCVIVDGMVRG